MVADRTQPPSSSGNGGTSVPPPAKLMRSGALARMSMWALRSGMLTVQRRPVRRHVLSKSIEHRASRPYTRHMDGTAPAILELGAVLLLAAGAGLFSRRLGFPAVVGYLAVGLAVSPFTPGYVADREQLRLLADLGVVILLFEVGIEIDILRLRREHSGLMWAGPLQVVLTTVISAVAFIATGITPIAAAILGLCVAFSSSVVVVNITRSRRRTTDRPTEEMMLGWSVLQDVSAVAMAAVLLVLLGTGERPVEIALPLLAGFVVLALGSAWMHPRAH